MNDSGVYDVYDSSIPNYAWAGLTKLFKANEILDITIIAKDGEVSAHKIVLAAVSAYFKLFLTSELTSKNVSSVDLSVYDIDTLNVLLKFIYTGKIQLTQKNILDMVELQDFLGIGILHHHLTYYMVTTLNDTNCWLYYEIAERHSYLEVFEKVDRYIRLHFMRLTTDTKSEFLNVSLSQLLSFFDGGLLKIESHEQLLISLCEWMGYAPDERLEYLEPVLANVDIARIPSWRDIPAKVLACFSQNHQDKIKEWIVQTGEQRNKVRKKEPFKESFLEVIFLIGGVFSGESVPSTDVFVPPLILSRVFPKSTDHKQLVIIPPMHRRRVKPTAVSTQHSVYVLGGTQNHEELKVDGIPCEVYRIKENRWDSLPNLPHNDKIKLSSNRRPPAAFAGGRLYAALPSFEPSFWVLSKNETCWERLPPPNCFELFDIVSVNGAIYCIGLENEDSVCYLLARYDRYFEFWYRISVFKLSQTIPKVKGLFVDNVLCVTSGDLWMRFDPHKSDWKKCKLAVSAGDMLPSLCTFKERQIVSLRFQEENPAIPSLELISANGASDFYLPGRSSAALANVIIPLVKPEPF